MRIQLRPTPWVCVLLGSALSLLDTSRECRASDSTYDFYAIISDAGDPFLEFGAHFGAPLPQRWYVTGGNTDFTLESRYNNTSRVPFSVNWNTPDDTLCLVGSGRIGIGTPAPAARLHVVEAAVSGAESVARFQVSDDTIGKLLIINATSANGAFIPKLQGTSTSTLVALAMEGVITTDSGPAAAIFYNARKAAGGAVVTRPLVVYQNNGVTKVTIAANGQITANGVVLSSSRTLKDNIVNLDSRKAAEALRQLTPVEFVYKDDATAEKQVGFIAEDVPELVANKDRKSVPIMDVVAVLTRVVKEQDRQLADERQRNDQQQTSLQQQRKTLDEQRITLDEQQQLIAQQQTLLAALNRRLTDLEQRSAGRGDPTP